MTPNELLLLLILFLIIAMLFLSKFFEKWFIAFGTLLVGGSIGFAIGHIVAPYFLSTFTDYGETMRAYFAFLIGMSTTFLCTGILRYYVKRKRGLNYDF